MSAPPIDPVFPDTSLIIGDGRVTDTAAGTHVQLDPSTGAELASVTLAGPAEIDQAVTAAHDAAPAWRDLAPSRRRDLVAALADVLDAHHEELSVLRSLELGAPMKKRKGANMAVEYIRYFAGWSDKVEGATIPVDPAKVLDFTVLEPYGTVAALTPFNGGIVSVAMKVVPALVAGNTVVLKPSELAALGPIRFGELALEAGIPPGVINVVPGGVDAGEALVGHPGVHKISFTGGTGTARKVLTGAAANLTPVLLELGGKSAAVVFDDGDIDTAVATVVFLTLAAMSGQGCVLPTRLLVADEIYDTVVDKVTAAAGAITVGRPFDDGVQAGPVITEAACERIVSMVTDAAGRGDGEVLCGGSRLDGDLADGFFVAPTVIGDVAAGSPIAQEEVFGPVLSLLRFGDEDEAVAIANDSRYGLGGLVFTRDLGRAHRVANRIEAGSVGVNAFPPMPASAPFGGVKHSGYGREGGRAGVEEFLRPKNIYVQFGA